MMIQRRIQLIFVTAIVLLCGIAFGTSAGAEVYSGNSVTINTDNAANGTIDVAYTGGGSKRIKVQVKKSGTYTYNLNVNGTAETFPMNMGSGTYTVTVFRNTSGSSYSTLYSTSFEVMLSSEFAPFLIASQYVDYDSNTKVIKKAASLVKGKSSDIAKVDAIYKYVIDLLNYDTQKAKTVKSGYLPDLDSIYSKKKGICFDYAAMLSAMLRSQGIPAKLITGYVAPDGLYHAWNEVYTKESGWVKKVIKFDGNKYVLMDPTFASYKDSSDSIMKFIANTSNYKVKYTY